MKVLLVKPANESIEKYTRKLEAYGIDYEVMDYPIDSKGMKDEGFRIIFAEKMYQIHKETIDAIQFFSREWTNPDKRLLRGLMFNKFYSGYALGYDWTANDKFAFVQRSTGSVNYEANFANTSSINNWYAIHGVYDSGAGQSNIYVNSASTTLSTPSRGSISATTIFYIGAIQATALKWNGYIDEVRVRGSALSSTWIEAEYSNMNTPTTFYWVGAQETDTPAGGGVNTEGLIWFD